MKRLVLSLCIFALLYTTGFPQTFAVNYPKVSCATYGADANGCNECFDGGGKYVGDVFQPNDTFNAGSQDRVYFQKRNGTVVRFNTLNSKTSWFKSDNLLRYPSGFVWYTANNGDKYHLFRANTSERILETQSGKGVRLQSVSDDSVDPNRPAFKLTFTAKYQTLLSPGNLAAERTHNECVFFEPRYCGDGILQTDKGESCDPRDPNRTGHGNGGCDTNTCRAITIAPVCKSLTVNKTTGTAPTSVVATCTGFNVDRFEIDCGNGQVFTGNGSNSGDQTFTRTCAYNSGGSFTPTCKINGSITSNSCRKSVSISNPTPSILIDKTDGNPSDFDGSVGNDRQEIQSGQNAIFKIRVTNNGSQESLQNIALNDTRAPACATQAGGVVNLSAKSFVNRSNQTVSVIVGGSGNHNNTTLETGEWFEYYCTEPNTLSNYTNTASTTALGVVSNTNVTDSDATEVILVGTPAIDIDKTDANPNDRDTQSDQQTVGVGEEAVFRITVRNSGSEDLQNVRLSDVLAASCATNGNTSVNFSSRQFIDGNGATKTISVSGAGNHNDNIFQINEVFSYSCDAPNTQASYTNTVVVNATGVDTNISVGDNDDSDVLLETMPSIVVDKTDANPDDRDTLSDSQTVLQGDQAVFRITVQNNGDEDLLSLTLNDGLAPACATAFNTSVNLAGSSFTNVLNTNTTISYNLASPGNHSDSILQVGEEFSYVCTRPNTQSSYVNSVSVNGIGVISGAVVTDSDTTPVLTDIIIYDLALAKTLSNTTPGPFRPGDTVTFDIRVTNQGNVVAQDIDVIDYVPTGLTFVPNQGNWVFLDPIALSPSWTINPGASVIRSISFTIDSSFQGTISNFAEISADDGDDCDSTLDGSNGNQLGETIATGLLNNNIGTGCNSGGDEDDHDIETIEVLPRLDYDLALIKTLSGATDSFTTGDRVIFNITVSNQGNVDSGQVIVTDYLPEGFDIRQSDNPDWIFGSDDSLTYVINNIAPGNLRVFPIEVIVTGNVLGQLTNAAEISSDNGVDCDSIPDNINGNQVGETVRSGLIDNDTGARCSRVSGDEDDHDIATINVGVYDLALRKLYSGEAIVQRGDSIIFRLEVSNQGSQVANNIELTDYIPSGLTLVDPNWTLSGSIATRVIPQILAGDRTFVNIELEVANTATGTIANLAEISADDGDDCDSTPDQIRNNDSLIDNQIGFGCEPGGDEDDHDIAFITVGDYDLALTKTYSGEANLQRGETAIFNITVLNQGDLDSGQVIVTDYLPAGFDIRQSDNPDWIFGSDDSLTYVINNIAPGNVRIFPIEVIVTGNVLGQLVNAAEISLDNGGDCDSTPDNIDGNQLGETLLTGLIDNAFGFACEPGGDEDDHDIALLNVTQPVANLNILKYSANGDDRDGVLGFFADTTLVGTGGTLVDAVNTALAFDHNLRNDTQSIFAGSGSIFQIFVHNSGETDIIDLIIDDPLAQACNRTAIETRSLISNVGNGDNIFNPGEIFAYSCTELNITADYTNTINIDAFDTFTGTGITRSDDSQVVLGVTPNIVVDKIDSNVADLDTILGNDTQTVPLNGTGSFTITVTNSGSEDLTGVTLVDLEAPACGQTASGALALIIATGGDNIFNVGESFSYTCADANITANYINSITVNATGITSNIATSDTDTSAVIVQTGGGNRYDLALVKTRVGTGLVSTGSLVSFNIEVFNQGQIAGNNIEITDYIPAGLTLTGSTWTQSGGLATQIIPSLPTGTGTVILPISFIIDSTATGSISNFAEISADDGDDCDSIPDNINGNQAGETLITGLIDNDFTAGCNPAGDEDDHDIETITIGNNNGNLYDLALRKTLNATGSTNATGSIFNIGDTVVFDIEVFNQGQLSASGVVITDYIPAGLTLTGSAWTQSGGLATQTIGAIPVGTGTVVLPISFVVDATATGSIVNTAEISSDDGDDCDSTPDQIIGNDAFTDDDIGSLCDLNPDDEDDHDRATITINTGGGNTDVPSIEVLKYAANPADTDGNTDDSNVTNDTQGILGGGTAIFKIVVSNDGDENLTNIVLLDALASACDRTALETITLIQTIGNNDAILNIGESFSYNCSDTGITADYTNSITVSADGVTANVTDTDTSFVDTPGGGGGGGSPQCSGISVSGNQVTCLSNLRVRSYRVDCDSSSTTDVNVFSSHDGSNYVANGIDLIQGRFEAKLNCPADTLNNPICYVAAAQNLTTTNNADWITDNVCRVTGGGGGGPRCGDGILHPNRGEQCEATIDTLGNATFPQGCSSSCRLGGGGGGGGTPGISTIPSQTGIYTFPQGGQLIFDIAASDIVLGNDMDVDEVIQDQPFFYNDSPYDIYIDSLCLVKQSGTSLEPKASVGPNFYDFHNTHGYCERVDTIAFPGDKIFLENATYEFMTTTDGIPGGQDFDDNIIAFTMTDADKKVYNNAYFAGQLKVRVAKPTIITTGGTAFFEDSFIANLADIADGIDSVDNTSTNFGGVVIGDQDSASDNAAVDGSEARDQATNENDALAQTILEDLSEPSATLKPYNGNDNIFIINGVNTPGATLKVSDITQDITQPTTFIVENANLIVDQDVTSDHNLGFIVRGGDIVVNADVETMDGSYLAIPKGSAGGNINGSIETNTQLVVNGSLYGDTKDLIIKRSHVQSADNRGISVGTIVSFGSSFFRDPAPLLGKFISEYTDSVKVAR